MSLTPGARLGPYEIVAPLGVGGMGEVYRARDQRLGRDVAVKVLPEGVAGDPERLARFEREARVLAAMSHSGIASIFGVEETGASRALIMELVEGPTLAERIESGPIPADDVLAIARQLADALEYAHDRGIVHRDLKPANVKLRPDGTVKVLDFGLARALESETRSQSGNLTHSPTITQRMTSAGLILGTAAYMAPEQARGREADRRADIWAFGAVLFEMLTGKKPFGGETISESLASVMRDEPDWSGLPKGLSPRWRRLLDRLLVKDPRQRMQAIGEARIVLEEIAANPNETSVASSPPSRTRAGRLGLVPWLLAGVALLALPFVYWKTLPVASSVLELSIVPAGGLKVAEDLGYHPMAISPNGLMVAYTVRIEGQLKLRIRRLNTRQDVEIPGTEGARNLFFSSDSQWVGFFDSRNMYKVSVHGGTPLVITDALQDRLGTWLADGTIVFSREVTEPLYRISESGGTPTAITKLDLEKRERTHRHPCALDGGPWVVFTVQTVESPGGYDDASIDAVSVATGERRHLYKGARRAVWAPGGYLILARGSDLYAAPIDPRNPRPLSDPVPVLSDVSGLAANGSSYFSIAGDGTLAWIPGGEPERTREVGWFDRLGRWTPTPIPPGPYLSLALSADAVRALVLGGPGGGNEDIWLADLRTGGMNQLTSGGRGGPAVWLRDGVSIAHSRPDSSGGERIVVRRLDGAGGEREIATATHPLSLTGLSPDGASVIYSDYGVRDGHIYIGSIDARTPTRSLPVEGGGYEAGGRLSPDGQWLLYVSTKSRREEVYVRHLSGGGSWQVSTGGGGGSRWGRDGREVFFVSREMLMRVPLEIRGGELSVGQPEPLFEPPPSPTEATYRDYDYDPKSDRFLFSRPIRGVADRREIALSLGWSKRLGEKVHPSR